MSTHLDRVARLVATPTTPPAVEMVSGSLDALTETTQSKRAERRAEPTHTGGPRAHAKAMSPPVPPPRVENAYNPRRGGNNAAKRVIDPSPGPWQRWRTASRAARCIRFLETFCSTPKGEGHGRPIRLAPFQKDWLDEILADGVDAAVLSIARANGKSSLLAGVGVWATFDDDETGSPQVPVIATRISQAVRSTYGVAAMMVKAHPELRSRALVFTGLPTPRIVVPRNNGELFPISNDPDGLQGLDYSLAIADEIGFQPIESWESLRMASGKRSRSLAVGMGTPGLDRGNALWHVRSLIKSGAVIPGLVYREYAAPEGCAIGDRAAWRAANPALDAGFLRESALETDLAISPEGHFRIFRLGQWHEGVDSWLGADGRSLWDALTEPYAFAADRPTFVGTDVAIKRDSTAVVAVQRDDEGMLHAAGRFWIPTAERPVDVTDVMQHLRDLASTYDVQAISYDKYLFDVPAKMLADERLPMVEIPQSVERMTPIIGSLFEAIKRGELRHDGDDLLATHVLNAVPRYSRLGFTLEKGKSRGKIDGAIALALAIDRALRAPAAPSEPLIAWR